MEGSSFVFLKMGVFFFGIVSNNAQRRLGRSYGNTNQTIADVMCDCDDLDQLRNQEFHDDRHAVTQRSHLLVRFVFHVQHFPWLRREAAVGMGLS